ncbi:MAG: ParB/RepB/Spo0J family partition protein [Gammaproteobacteria bacterium]|jgi:ParB family transcriptional regulator, chromosome partitioning protein|nr:ParB/RepB/Spo0J family partition protein [Gammaproteobacteria bacterium]MBT4147450.1 ParB/RepB/Spo0J family partition protein [Gammaproteobacteria bacterium]MBT5222455.1 ParB/RepB/Spo0J family partition protein [Gammaproteobacteria bacterium]MBT5824639.1 ParB/RepB/Spo0J family partition protein [Gammaproteobacteria bacterium]MBT5967046.1 ParB/RepB/Spo0J family partition protein [Gammaproteobacteria bacterium]
MAEKKRGLGKGLGALMGDLGAKEQGKSDVQTLPVEHLQRGKYQPRKDIDPERLQELAESIKSQGIVQPIVVREVAYNKYEIIAGERRWRAGQLAGLADVPVLIKNIDDRTAIAISLIENIQREDLNPLEEAEAFLRLIGEFDLTHQQVADSVGKSRAAVTNMLRLNDLDSEVKNLLAKGRLGMGHARALLTLESEKQLSLANKVAEQGLSVRVTEKLVKDAQKDKQGNKEHITVQAHERVMDRDTQHLQDAITNFIGAKTIIKHKHNGQGSVVISYNSLDELEGIVSRLEIRNDSA